MQIIAIDTDTFTVTDRPIIATFGRVHELEPEAVRTFTGDEYADWAEHNHLAGIYPWPSNFYGLTTEGTLVHLTHEATIDDFDQDDYATVANVWTTPDGESYAIGLGRRDGRA